MYIGFIVIYEVFGHGKEQNVHIDILDDDDVSISKVKDEVIFFQEKIEVSIVDGVYKVGFEVLKVSEHFIIRDSIVHILNLNIDFIYIDDVVSIIGIYRVKINY